MLEYVTKEKYWRLVEDGVEEHLRKGVFPWHLKSVQDTVAMSFLMDLKGKDIAEIGGGDSRILPHLSKANTCFNIETFEGRHGGPAEEILFEGVENVAATVGLSHDTIDPEMFDVVFSVSVVEHIAIGDIAGFIADCRRILRPGGTMIHLVDMYLSEVGQRPQINRKLLNEYEGAFRSGFVELQQKSEDPIEPVFSTSYCTNPDNIMWTWNEVAPDLRGLRESAQSVTLVWAGKSVG